MAQYTINSNYASFIGMDVHARTTTARGMDLETGELHKKRFSDCPNPEEIASWAQATLTAPHYGAYESGCTGFHMCRELIKCGIDCDVMAVSSIARSTEDRLNKDDHMDAKRMLSELLNPMSTLSRVWLPDTECEGVRDFLRCYRDVSDCVRRAKQQTTSLLLRHGIVYNEKTPSGNVKSTWTKDFMKWLDTIDLGTVEANGALSYCLAAVAENTARKERMFAQVKEIANKERYKPYVDAFCCISGIDVYTAMVYAAEIGDFSRFKNGRSVSKWAGVTSKNSSSGDKHSSGGHITKAGSAHVRCALVEGCSSMDRRRYKPVTLERGQMVSERIIAACNRCNRRLIDRYRHLVSNRKKKVNVAKIAVASEMIRWVWAIGCMVQEEQRTR